MAAHVPVVLVVGLILLITVADITASRDVHLSSLLIVAPAITASFEGPNMTGAIAVLTITAGAAPAVSSRSIGRPGQPAALRPAAAENSASSTDSFRQVAESVGVRGLR
ncbi:hypothetical protein GCM10029978_064790 [Actinoallomurus acanthiterrae]